MDSSTNRGSSFGWLLIEMKFSSKEEQILFVVTALIGLNDFFTLSFNSFLITLIFAALLYTLTESLYFIALVLLVPQFIRLVNKALNMKEGIMNPQEVSKRLEALKAKESFNNPNEVSQRVENLLNTKVDKIKEVSGIVDISQPSGVYPIEGNQSYPNFSEETMGTPVSTNTHIYTVTESAVPAMGILDSFPKQNPYVPNYDDLSINVALARTTNTPSINSSNIKGV